MNVKLILFFFIKKSFLKLNYDVNHAMIYISRYDQLSDYQCNGAMKLSKELNISPLIIANNIIENIDKSFYYIADIEISSSGFINIKLKDQYLSYLCNMQFFDKKLLIDADIQPQKIYLDFGGFNIAKNLHVGHLRSLFLGDCLQKINRFFGNIVISDVHLGDWGLQIGMVIYEILLQNCSINNFKKYNFDLNKLTLDSINQYYCTSNNKCKMYIQHMCKAREITIDIQSKNKYYDLWINIKNISVKSFQRTCKYLNIHFNLWYGESDNNNIILNEIINLKNRNIAVEDKRDIVIRLNQFNMTPFILLKSDGFITYGATDLITAFCRIKNGAQKIIYIVDKRQSLHFNKLFKVINMLYNKVNLIHIGFGTINNVDNKPFKTRNDDNISFDRFVENLREKVVEVLHNKDHLKKDNKLIHKIILSTMKFYDLSNHYSSNYIFDFNKCLKFEGKTGIYILYTAVRIKSVLKKINIYDNFYFKILPACNVLERQLQFLCLQFNDNLKLVYKYNSPHYLCSYVFNLSSLYNKFYSSYNIMNEKNYKLKYSRINLSILVLKILNLSSYFLGIIIPDQI